VSRYEVHGNGADLDDAIALLGGILRGDVVPQDDGHRAAMATNLANALRHRHLLKGERRDVDRAVALYETLASLAPDEPTRRLREVNLTSGLMTRFDGLGDLSDLDRAITLMQSTATAMPDDETGKATLSNNLGLALLKRFAITKQRGDLAGALGAAVASVRLLRPGAPEATRHLTNCGTCFLQCYRELNKPEMLDQAIDALLHAVATLPDGSPESSRPFGAASDALLERFALHAHRDDVDRAVSLAARGVDVTSSVSSLRPGALAQLAEALRRRSGSEFAQPTDVADGVARYRDAVTGGLAETPAVSLESGLQWGAWAREREEWSEAAEALLLAMDAHQTLLASQRDRPSRELRLQRIQGLGAVAADSLIRNGQPGRAMVALERSRALLTAHALRRRPDDVTFLGIVEKIPKRPLVYLEDVDGGFALIAQDGRVRVVQFPELREERVNQWLAAHISLRVDDPEAWERELTALCRWLWDAVMGPLIDALGYESKIALVAGGYLGMLPLRAAWTEDASAPTGRRYAVDAMTIQYAPSAGALRADGQMLLLNSILCVDEPKPVKAPPLPFSRAEVAAAAARFDAKTILRGRDATPQAVLDALADHSVMHLSCHGAADLDQPLDNGLLLSGGQFLTLRELLEARLDHVELAVLSACDTGQMGKPLPDEAIGLPAGLLQAGARAVVSPLWPVDSFSTLLLLARFYERLFADGAGVSEALAAAQRWVRDTTNAEKVAHFGNVAAIRRELLLREPDAREQAAITEWAAFTCCGG
jgi:CHAT domain-containing protein